MGVSLSRNWLLLSLAALSFLFVLHYFRTEQRLALLTSARSLSASAADDDAALLIYNRLPKTASTTLMHLPYELCAKNNFHVLLLNISRPQHMLTLQDQMFFARNISAWADKRPALYHGHFAFIDFARLGGVSPRPLYINLVRQPLDRLVSYYYFLRYGDDFRVNKVRSRQGDKVTFDECVHAKMPDCDPKKLWLQIPWFCGHFKKCWEPGNRWALEQAKHNLVHKYLLVGLTEDLETFIQLLELTLPRFFGGATRMFADSGQLQHIRKTKHKDEPSAETVKLMQDTRVWKMENEFYEFAAAHFHWLKAELQQSKGERLFHYEKVRP